MVNRVVELKQRIKQLEQQEGDVQQEIENAQYELEALDRLQEAAEQAAKHIWKAITELENLTSDLCDVGEGNAAAQLESYMIPHLGHWLEDVDQAGSLAMIQELLDERYGLQIKI